MIKGRVSVLIPSRNERYLQATVTDLLTKAAGDVEIIIHLDEQWPDPPLMDNPKQTVIFDLTPVGMRAGINACAALAKGEYFLKADAHTMWEQGWDEILKRDIENDWVSVPTRLSLDVDNWAILETGKPPVTAHFLSWPYEKENELGMHGNVWNQRSRDTAHEKISDEMSSQGSAYFMTRKHWERLGGLSEVGYRRFVQEFQEIGCKTWLGGGRVICNKNTTYAHWHKGKPNGRGYFIAKKEMAEGTHYSADFWLKNKWKDRKYDFEWLVEKFNPPKWPTDWRDHVNDYQLGEDKLLHRVGE